MDLFFQLPAYSSTYHDVPNPVISVKMPSHESVFAFVVLIDEVVTNTFIQMSGFELLGRPIRIGRPQGYKKPPYGELNPLELAPLRQCGLLPPEAEVGAVINCVLTSSRQELYFGNLSVGDVSEKEMRDLLLPICLKLPEYDEKQGPPITNFSLARTGRFCFIQFQNVDLASKVMSIFDGMIFFGCKLRVGRPANYHPTVQVRNQPSPVVARLFTE